VRALEDRIAAEITFPRLLGYRYEIADQRLRHEFTADARLALSTADVPTRTENAPIVGEHSIHTLDDLKRHRPNEVAFLLTKLVLTKYFSDDQGGSRPWLFPQVLAIVKQWMAQCITLKDHTFVQMLLLTALANDAADKVYRAIVKGSENEPVLKPVLQPYDTLGSTRYVDFDTTRQTYLTHYERCHVSHVAIDSGWEAILAERLEEMDEVRRYVKNQSLGFTIPYTLNGEQRHYVPDYIVCLDDGHGPDNLLNLIVEVTGERKKDKVARVETARTLWTPAVNQHGGFGRWKFLEITDPWDAVNTIRYTAHNGNGKASA
jgi:type III restriction enzyme